MTCRDSRWCRPGLSSRTGTTLACSLASKLISETGSIRIGKDPTRRSTSCLVEADWQYESVNLDGWDDDKGRSGQPVSDSIGGGTP